MTFNRVLNAAIATAAITLIANLTAAPQAKAYEVGLCQAASELSFVDENGQSGYYAAGEQFACTTPNGNTLVGLKNNQLVVVTQGAVIVNGSPAIIQAGQAVAVERNASEHADIAPGYGTTDYVDRATYDAGYRTDYGDGPDYINTYEPSYP